MQNVTLGDKGVRLAVSDELTFMR